MPGLLQLADFKWLMMACEGQRIDLGRLQTDRGYALDCLQRALGAHDEVVRQCAARLLRQFGAPGHPAPAPLG